MPGIIYLFCMEIYPMAGLPVSGDENCTRLAYACVLMEGAPGPGCPGALSVLYVYEKTFKT